MEVGGGKQNPDDFAPFDQFPLQVQHHQAGVFHPQQQHVVCGPDGIRQGLHLVGVHPGQTGVQIASQGAAAVLQGRLYQGGFVVAEYIAAVVGRLGSHAAIQGALILEMQKVIIAQAVAEPGDGGGRNMAGSCKLGDAHVQQFIKVSQTVAGNTLVGLAPGFLPTPQTKAVPVPSAWGSASFAK